MNSSDADTVASRLMQHGMGLLVIGDCARQLQVYSVTILGQMLVGGARLGVQMAH